MAGSHTPTPARDTSVDSSPLTLVSTVEHGLSQRLADRVDGHLATCAEHMREGEQGIPVDVVKRVKVGDRRTRRRDLAILHGFVTYVRMVKDRLGGEGRADRAVERGSREIEHLGSAHDEAELEAVKAAARQRLAAGQGELRPRAGGGGVGPAADRGRHHSGFLCCRWLSADSSRTGTAGPSSSSSGPRSATAPS